MTKWHTHITGWTCRARNTHSEYVILIAFAQQQWLHERPSALHYSTLHVLLSVKPGDTLSGRKASN
jgi:hypothetical protein